MYAGMWCARANDEAVDAAAWARSSKGVGEDPTKIWGRQVDRTSARFLAATLVCAAIYFFLGIDLTMFLQLLFTHDWATILVGLARDGGASRLSAICRRLWRGAAAGDDLNEPLPRTRAMCCSSTPPLFSTAARRHTRVSASGTESAWSLRARRAAGNQR